MQLRRWLVRQSTTFGHLPAQRLSFDQFVSCVGSHLFRVRAVSQWQPLPLPQIGYGCHAVQRIQTGHSVVRAERGANMAQRGEDAVDQPKSLLKVPEPNGGGTDNGSEADDADEQT